MDEHSLAPHRRWQVTNIAKAVSVTIFLSGVGLGGAVVLTIK